MTMTTLELEVVDRCPLCGGQRKRLEHGGLVDDFYGTPGQWAYHRCLDCGLSYLDPRPTAAEIGKAYADYATHAPVELPQDPFRRVRAFVRTGYLAQRFGYRDGVGIRQRAAGWLAYLHPGQREAMGGSVMYLSASQRGRLLDVGPGAGQNLLDLRQLGWQVQGVEPDPRAAERAVQHLGLDVRVGLLHEQYYPSEHFDAVIMIHVLEHVHDPVALLRECRRILRPGGTLVVATPNVKSLGYRLFARHWRVLEVPRHLTLFSCATVARAASAAGFDVRELRTTTRGADGIFYQSVRGRRGKPAPLETHPAGPVEKLQGQMYQYVEAALLQVAPELGEEILLQARRS